MDARARENWQGENILKIMTDSMRPTEGQHWHTGSVDHGPEQTQCIYYDHYMKQTLWDIIIW